MVITIRLLEEESQRDNQQDQNTQKVSNVTTVREPVNMRHADTLKLVNIEGYKLISAYCRNKTIHGGVAILINSTFKCKTVEHKCFCREIHAEVCAIEFVNNNEKCTLSDHYEKIIIIGDFNVNSIRNSRSLKTLKCLTRTYNIDSTIFEPTRLGSSSSCIDNILTNFSQATSSKVIDCCMSNHLAEIIQIEIKEQIKSSTEMRWSRKINQKLLSKICENRPPVRWYNNKLREMKETLCAINDMYDLLQIQRHYDAYRQLYKKSLTDTSRLCYENFIISSNN
nr:unnamed protein product [Callosobruchus chinensis]